MNLPDNPKEFYSLIPTDIQKNLEFRIELHKLLATDKKAQAVYIQLCKEYLPIIFSTTFFTYNPQSKPGFRNVPFILRPAQVDAVLTLNQCIDEGRDVGINKSRKQGASEICAKVFIAKCLLEEDSHFILGSRKKELVDCQGDRTTLFGKCDNAINCLPGWWKELCGYDAKHCRKDMQLVIPETNGSIQGETTNESFSAGSRATAVCLDEFGRVEPAVANAIEGSVHDVSNCIIYSSTHWYGAGHPFNQCINKETTERIDLYWYSNPEENYGLYKNPEPGIVELVDADWWLEKYPEIKNYAN